MSFIAPLKRLVAFGTAATLLALAAVPAAAAAQSPGAGPLTTQLEIIAKAAVKLLDVPMTTTRLASRAETIQGVNSVIGLAPLNSATPSYVDTPPTLSAYGAIEAAVANGLMAGWASTSGSFDPAGPLTRIQLAILATNALGLDSEAAALIDDTKTYDYLSDLLLAGYNLGFANEMLKEGVVPPLDDVRYAPNVKLTQPVLAVTLYRMWLQYDLPFTAALAAQSPDALTNHADALTLSTRNALGTGIPPVNFARYSVAYSVQGPNAAYASVSGGAFSASAPGEYTVVATITGPLLQTPVTAQTTIDVTAPVPTGPTATEVGSFDNQQGGIRVQWSAVPGATGYELEYSDNGTAYTPVPATNGGDTSAGVTSSVVLGGTWRFLDLGSATTQLLLQASHSYTFEVVASLSGGTTQTSATTNSVVYGAPPVTDIQYVSEGSSDVEFQWTSAGGNTTGYEIWLQTAPTTWTEYGSPLPFGTAKVTIANDILSDVINVAVVAVDAAGNGTPSPAFIPE